MKRRVVTIACDTCSTLSTGRPGDTADHIRDRLADAGWWCAPTLDVDICPSHLPGDPITRPLVECPHCHHRWTIAPPLPLLQARPPMTRTLLVPTRLDP